MSLGRRFTGVVMVLAMLLSVTVGGTSSAATTSHSAAPLKNTLTMDQTAKKFLHIAYTWNKAWYNGGPSIGKRDVRYADQAVDSFLKQVYVGPDAMANETSWTPSHLTIVAVNQHSDGVWVVAITLDIDGHSFGEASVNLLKGKNGWKAVGTYLLAGSGPSKYCVDSPAYAAYCGIYPPGSY